MKSILGIGTAGSSIVEQLSSFDVYQAYQISNEVKKTSKYRFSLPLQSGPEEYESMDMSKLHKWLDKIEKYFCVELRTPRQLHYGPWSTYIKKVFVWNWYISCLKLKSSLRQKCYMRGL